MCSNSNKSQNTSNNNTITTTSNINININSGSTKSDKTTDIKRHTATEANESVTTPQYWKSSIAGEQDTDNFSTAASNTNGIIYGQTKGKQHRQAQSQKEKRLLILIARFSVLSVVIAISSTVFLILAIILSLNTTDTGGSVIQAMVWILMSVDAGINQICLILYFEFAVQLYKIFCPCATNKCVARVMPKILCGCCKS